MKTFGIKSGKAVLEDAFKATANISKPVNWIAKNNRPTTITDNPESNIAIARLLELCHSKYHYVLPGQAFIVQYINILGMEKNIM